MEWVSEMGLIWFSWYLKTKLFSHIETIKALHIQPDLENGEDLEMLDSDACVTAVV